MLQLEKNGVLTEVLDEDCSEILSDTVLRYLIPMPVR